MSLIARIASLTNRDRITTVGLALTAAWLFLVALFWLLAPGGTGAGGVARLVGIMGVVLPLALIWLGVSLARRLEILQAEASDLRATLTRMRRAGGEDMAGDEMAQDGEAREDMLTDGSSADTMAPDWGTGHDADAVAGSRSGRPVAGRAASAQAPSGQTGSGRAGSGQAGSGRAGSGRAGSGQTGSGRADTGRATAQPASRPAPQPGTLPAAARTRAGAEPRAEVEATQTDPATLIRALNFPDGPDDVEAIEALRQALRDPGPSRVLRAAQDVVTLMAGRDVYMDELPPRHARPDVWRRFAQGERGSAVAALGGIHQPEALEIAAALMRDDEIFRDTAHHFLRHFDGLAARLVPDLDDLQIAVLADSRTARAFMLIGRVSGVFG